MPTLIRTAARRPQTLAELIRHAAPPAQPILNALADAQARHSLFPPNQTAIVAVSGGADSICLLHALHQIASLWQITLHVAHLDHALRPDSAADSQFVAAFAHQLGLPITQHRLTSGTLDDDPNGQEAAARFARYTFLRQVATQLTANAAEDCGTTGNARILAGPKHPNVTIATAHHQDDQAETLLLHLVQGSGLHGLAGMTPVGNLPDNRQPALRLVRPLLTVSRAAIHAYLHSYGLTWREDSSNDDLAHPRNLLRHQVLPQLAAINPNIHATLARTASLLAAEADHAERRDQAMLAAHTVEHTPSTRLVLNWFPLCQTDEATQRGVVRLALLTLGIDLRTIGSAGIDTLLDRAHTPTTSGPHPLTTGWAWSRLSFRSRSGAKHGVCDEESPYAWSMLTSGKESNPTATNNNFLTIHRADALPIAVHHPHLAAPLPSPIPLASDATLTLGDWQLTSTIIPPDALPADWRDRAQPWRLFADADTCGELRLTTYQTGMRIAPLGMNGHQRALGDIFTDRKVPPALRVGWPVIVNELDTVIWLCGLVVAERVRVQPATRQIRSLHWQLETPTT